MTVGLQHPDLNRFIGGRFGKYRAFVMDNNDPEKMGRIKVNIPSLYLNRTTQSGWALPCGVSHVFRIPSVGEMVWVEFEEGDVERVIWNHGGIVRRSGINQVDHHTQGLTREEDNGGGRVSESLGQTFSGEYKTVETWNAGGNIIEIDSTEGANRILIQHTSGSRFEILPDGSLHQVNSGHHIERTKGNEQSIVYGNSELRSENRTQYTRRNKFERIDGDDVAITEGTTTTIRKKVVSTASSVDEKVIGAKKTTVGGDCNESVSGNKNELILGALNIIVANYLSSINPTANSVNIHNTTGTLTLKSGPGIVGSGVDANQITMDGLANILVQAIARAVITAPVVQLGATQVTAVNNAAKAIPLITWLATHTHSFQVTPLPAPPVPTTPPSYLPLVPWTPAEEALIVTGLTASVASPTVLID